VEQTEMSVQTPNFPTAAMSNSGRQDSLHSLIQIVTRRIRVLRLVRTLSLALCISACIGILAVGLGKLRVVPAPAPALLFGIIALGILIGAAFALLPKLSALDVAKLTERRADLKERLSSAVEFEKLKGSPTNNTVSVADFYREQLLDANQHAGAIDVKKLFPLRIPRTLPIGIVTTLALFLMFFLPTLPMFWSKQKKDEVAEVKKQGIAIVKLAQDTSKDAEQQKLDETKKAAEEVRKIGEQMKKGTMGKKEALVAMQKLTKKMEDQQKKLAEENMPKKSMKDAGKDFKKSADDMKKAMEEAQKKDAEAKKMVMGQKPRDPAKPMDKAAEAMQQKQQAAMKQMQEAMQQMAQALANQDNQQMKQAMEKMAQQMEQGTMSKEQMQQMQKTMQQLAKALENTQMQLSAEQMKQLAQMMQSMSNPSAEQMKQMAGMMKKLGEGMGKMQAGMGKAMLDAKMLGDLTEALKNGRMTMAMGNRPGNGMGGKGPGKGYGGSGQLSKAMKDPGATKPRLMVGNQSEMGKAIGKPGSASDFAKYLAMTSAASKHLPNAKVNGDRSQQGQELSISTTGDPDPTHSSAPYYKVYETSKRRAESSLSKENVPAAYKKQVRDYFDSIH